MLTHDGRLTAIGCWGKIAKALKKIKPHDANAGRVGKTNIVAPGHTKQTDELFQAVDDEVAAQLGGFLFCSDKLSWRQSVEVALA